jgi:hypothetical protein
MIRTILGPMMVAFVAMFWATLAPASATAQSIGMADAWTAFKEFKETELDIGKQTSADGLGTRKFLTVMRLYWAKLEVLDGKWKAPALVQVADVKTASLSGAVPVTAENFPPGRE